MIRASGAAGVGENEDPLLAAHECLRLDEIGAGGAGLELLPAVAPDHEPPGPPGHLGNGLGAEPLEQGVERRPDRRQRAELLDELVGKAAVR